MYVHVCVCWRAALSPVDEAAQVGGQHGEQEVGAAQEGVVLQLAHHVHQVERRPRAHERHRHDDDHTRHLRRRGGDERFIYRWRVGLNMFYLKNEQGCYMAKCDLSLLHNVMSR